LERVAQSCIDSISHGGEIVLCHWLGETDYPLTGVEASELFAHHIKPAMLARSILHDAIYRLEKSFRRLRVVRSCRTIIFAMAICRGRFEGRSSPPVFNA